MDKNKLFEYVKIKKGELPVTKFISYPESVDVDMIDYPNEKRIKKVFVNFSTGSWYPNYSKNLNEEEINLEIKDLLSGKSLNQGIETAQFTFFVSGINLHDSHALVRNRVGISYLQQSLAVRDLRNENILVPHSYSKHTNLLNNYKKWILDSKMLYSKFMDTGNISIADARLSLSKTIPVWIYFSCNLMTLISLVGKRLDSQEESIGLNEMSKQIVKLVIEKFPYMKEFLKSNCDKGTCFHLKKGYKANCIYKRDDKHIIVNYKDEFTLHDKTKAELSSGEKIKVETYRGYEKLK